MESATGTMQMTEIEALLGSVALPHEVESIRAELGEDSDRLPALWIMIQLRPGAIKQRADIKKITDFGGELQRMLLAHGFGGFPYLRLVDAA
jgi:hypothetical protein